MSLRKVGGRGTNMGHGDIDLEALQEAFLRNREKPSAKVIRSKPPTIKVDSSLGGHGVVQEAHVRASKVTSDKATGDGGIGDVVDSIRTAPSVRGTSTSTAFRKHNQAAAAEDAASLANETQWNAADPAASTGTQGSAGGGMVLDAPDVVSNVREREVRAPAPIKIAVGRGGAVHSSRGQGREKRRGISGTAGVLGGFPAVRHRSEMGSLKLGELRAVAAAAEAPVVSAAAVQAKRRSTRGSGNVNGSSGDGIPYEIHQENLSRVASMSASEIAEAQQEIRATLSSSAIETLMRRARDKRRGRATLDKDGSGDSGGRVGNQIVVLDSVPTRDAREILKRGMLLSSGGRPGGGVGGDTPGTGRGAARGGDRRTPVAYEAPAQNTSAESATAIAPAAIADSLASAESVNAPTCAQRVATAVGGVGSEQALQAALQMLPSEERAKSCWTLSDGAVMQGSVAGGGNGREARVDLDGELVVTAAEEISEALHHHGDDPDKAGYTPSELVRLARSTVSGQKQLALRALAGVLVNRAVYIRRGDLPPHSRLPQMLPIAIRMCIDDSNPAVALAALRATEAFLAPLAQSCEEAEDKMQGLSWLDYQAFPPDARPLCTPEEEATLPRIDNALDVRNPSDNGSPGMEGDTSSTVEIARMCFEDPCRGFLEMALLPKLSSMIKTCAVATAAAPATGEVDVIGGLHPRAALSCLRVLRAIAERASWAAVRIAREPRLLEALREAFLEPRADGSLLFDLSEGPSTSPLTAANRASPEHLALLAVRLTRTLVQSGRDVALFLATTPLLGSTKGLLALAQGLRRPRQSLLSMQREVLELWRCCLSYGIDVSSADTVVLLSRSQGWWPGLDAHPDASASLSAAATITTDHNNGHASCLGNPAEKGTMVDVNGDRDGELAVPPKLGFLRAMHQLACACVLPLKQKEGLGMDDGVPAVSGGDTQRPAARDPQGEANEKEDRAPLLLGGVSVALETWADVGDTVDAAVEACLRRLLSDLGNGGGHGGTVEIAIQSASIHLVACWLERYRFMSRTAGQRSVQRLETTAEDAVLLFSSLLASRSLPVAVEKGRLPSDARNNNSSSSNDSGCRGGVVGDRKGPILVAVSGDEAIGVDVAVAATAALDWLSGVFRLGLACDPREAALALAAAPVINTAALLNFFAANPFVLCGKEWDREGVVEGKATRRRDVAGIRRSLRRGSASARWLGCRLLGFIGEDAGCASAMTAAAGGVRGKSGWEALRRDCALNAVSLCEPGQEAVAVGLIAEGLRDGSPGSRDTDISTGAPSVLWKLFRGAVSDLAAFKHASFHLDGRWNSLQSLGASPPPGTASLLPLPQHWLFLPLASQGGERAASTAVSACLSILAELEREDSSYVATGDFGARWEESDEGVAPEVKLYHLMNACMYGASVFSGGDDLAEENFDWLLGRYLDQCGRGFESRLVNTIARLSIASAPDPAKIIADAVASAATSTASSWARPGDGGESTARERAREARAQSHAERALLEFVKDLVGSFLADSFGLPSFAKVLRVFVMTGFPVAARCVIWKELGAMGLLSLLDAPSSRDRGRDESNLGNHSWSEAYLYPVDTDPAILEAYLIALEHPRFDEDSSSPGDAEDNNSGCSDFGQARTAEVAAPAGVAILVRESMRTVAVHHLACYLFPVATGGKDFHRKEDAMERPLAWQLDFGRRKTMERLLLLAGLRGGNEVLGSALASVLGHECAGTKWWSPCDSKIPYRPTAVGVFDSVNERGDDPSGAMEQQGEAERAHRIEQGGKIMENNIETCVVSDSSSPLQLTREEAAGTCSRRRCLWLTTLGSCRRKLLQSYCFGGGSAGILTGAVDDGGAEETERGGKLIEWLNGEDRCAGDVIQRLLSRAA